MVDCFLTANQMSGYITEVLFDCYVNVKNGHYITLVSIINCCVSK